MARSIGFNSFIGVGLLTDKVELMETKSGYPMAKNCVVIRESFKNKAGELVDKALFLKIILWGKAAENFSQIAREGEVVMVQGKIEFNSWTDRQSEVKKTSVQLNVEKFSMMYGCSEGQSDVVENSYESPEGEPF